MIKGLTYIKNPCILLHMTNTYKEIHTMTQAEKNIIEALVEIARKEGQKINDVDTYNKIADSVAFHVPAFEYCALTR